MNEVQPHDDQVFCVGPGLFRDSGVQIVTIAITALFLCAARELHSMSWPILGSVLLYEFNEPGVFFRLPLSRFDIDYLA